MNNEFFSNNAAAIIGVAGTILGAVVGWLLNSLSQFGRLHIYDKSWKGNMFRPERGCVCEDANSIDEVERYEFTATIDIYIIQGKIPK